MFQFANHSQTQQDSFSGFRAGNTIVLELDSNNGTLSFSNPGRGDEKGVLHGITGEVFPCVCFDYGSKATLLAQEQPASSDWAAAAAAAWAAGKTATDAIAQPDQDWTVAHDEQLSQAIAAAKPGLPVVAALADLTKYQMINTTPTSVLLRRARLLTRYSSMVMSVLPLVELRGTGLPMTGAIGQLRGLIQSEHKRAVINRILAKVKSKAKSGGHPNFKVARAKTLALVAAQTAGRPGRPLAADGSESIAYQIHACLKQAKSDRLDSLYSGREIWWQVEFIGEGVQASVHPLR